MMLSPTLDLAPARQALETRRRGQVENLLAAADYQALIAGLEGVKWNLVTRLGGAHRDLDAAAMDTLPAAKRAEFERRVLAEARTGFQYLYETYPIYDKWHAGLVQDNAPVLSELFEFINSDAFLDPMRDLLGAPDIGFADAQLTRYRGGHFLTTHDDAVAGKNRVAAYVLSLTEGWQEAWGGTLDFYAPDGSVEARFVPGGNRLSLFKVPQPHAVTPVLPLADRPRYSITGWLRTGRDPGPG